MEKRRTPIALAIAVMSLGLIAACSDEADQPADAPVEQVTPAPSTPPVDSTPPADSTPVPPATPDPGNTMPPPVEESSPQPDSNPPSGNDPLDPLPDSTSSSSAGPGLTEKLAASGQALQASAVNVAHAVGDKAGELRAATSERMSKVGQAIRDGAARADETIQESVDGGGEPTHNAQQPAGI